MSEVKHTPGPWSHKDDGDAHFIGGPEGSGWIAKIDSDYWLGNHEQLGADVRLMASAPDLEAENAVLREELEDAKLLLRAIVNASCERDGEEVLVESDPACCLLMDWYRADAAKGE